MQPYEWKYPSNKESKKGDGLSLRMTHNGLGQRTRSEKEGITERISIYIYKEESLFVCLFVLYAFGPCKS